MSFTTKTIFNSLIKDNVLKVGKSLDIGCRDGRDAINLAKEGFVVEALDSDEECVKNILVNTNITPIVSRIEDFKIQEKNYDLISCQYVLHFLSKEVTKDVIYRMVEGAKVGGIIVFTLLGNKDDWKNVWSVWQKEEFTQYLSTLPVDIFKVITEEGMGKTRKGPLKYWHVFNIVLIRK